MSHERDTRAESKNYRFSSDRDAGAGDFVRRGTLEGNNVMSSDSSKPRNGGETMKEAVYGFPCVENPHDFEPDRESCTEKGIAFWEDAKSRWDAGEKDVRGQRCHFLNDEQGKVTGHVTATSWGIGVNMVDMEEFESKERP